MSRPSLLTSLDTRSSFSPHGFQGLIWPLFWQVLLDRVVCQVRALVVLPTKELAQQVCNLALQLFTENWAEGRAGAGNILSGCSGMQFEHTVSEFDVINGKYYFH